MRIALGVEYDGSGYHGWQRQDHDGLITVQESIESALTAVANHPVNVVCAGRTDAGVHALGQVVHFDTEAHRTEHSWVYGANSNLSHDVSIRWAKVVVETFHARYSATARRYRYLIYNHPIRSSIWHRYVTWQYRQLSAEHMQEAATYLIGEHDFSSFRGIDCQSPTPVREIYEISIKRKNHWLVLEIKANAFLHHMVRNIAGVLIEIGANKRAPIWTQEVLAARDRTKAGITAPANGLYLMEVDYPEEYELPRSIGSIIFEELM